MTSRTTAVWAVIFSLIAIFLYLLLRFSKWQYSLGAVAATVHDTIIVLGAFSLLDGVVALLFGGGSGLYRGNLDSDRLFIE